MNGYETSQDDLKIEYIRTLKFFVTLVRFPNLTRAYGNNVRRSRQEFIFGILQLFFTLFSPLSTI